MDPFTSSPVTAVPELPSLSLKPLLGERRTKANKRERDRVQSLREAFRDLGGVVPKDASEPQLTRIDVVRRATDYIDYLANILESDETKSQLTASEAESTASSETTTEPEELRSSYLDWQAECDSLERLPEKRVKCNERARTRSRHTKEAFSSLKDILPIHPAEAELSRIEVLRRASEYIALMANLLDECNFEEQLLQVTGCDVLSTTDNTSVSPLSDLFCSPDTGASHSSTASPVSLTLDLANVNLAPLNFPCYETDSDYASQSPPSSAASDCSFTFPSAINTAVTYSAVAEPRRDCTVTTTVSSRPHSSLARSSSHPYAGPCSPRPRLNSTAQPWSSGHSLRRRQHRSFSDSDIVDLELESFLQAQTGLLPSYSADFSDTFAHILEPLPTTA